MDARLILMVVALVVAAVMLRWDVQPLASNNSVVLDRWSGSLTFCSGNKCFPGRYEP